MHVLVTGATGFVGFHTVKALLAAGHTVRFGVRNVEKMERLYQPHNIDCSDYSKAPITNKKAVTQALKGCDAVVHTAAMVSMNAADSERMLETNLGGTQNVIEAALESGIERIVHVSSVSVLSQKAGSPITEETPYALPKSGYARSKIAADKYVRGKQAEGAKIAATYPTGIIGPDDPSLSEMMDALAYYLNNTHLITSSGQQCVDVRDIADIHVKLLEAKASGAYVLGGHFLSYPEQHAMLEVVTGKHVRTMRMPGGILRAMGGISDLLRKAIPYDTIFTAEAMYFATKFTPASNQKVEREFNFTFRPAETSYRDSIRFLAATGKVKSGWADNIISDT